MGGGHRLLDFLKVHAGLVNELLDLSFLGEAVLVTGFDASQQLAEMPLHVSLLAVNVLSLDRSGSGHQHACNQKLERHDS